MDSAHLPIRQAARHATDRRSTSHRHHPAPGMTAATTRLRDRTLYRWAVAMVLAGMLCAPGVHSIPSAFARSCPAVQVIFARGTGEAPGPGPTGQAFIDALRQRLGAEPVDAYAVNYPASDQWSTGIDGIRDASDHVIAMAGQCPATQMVLGGYSQGAAVMGFVTSAAVPDGVDPSTVPKPLDPAIAQHVSSVVLFGMPNVRAMNFLGQPPVVIGPAYEAKTIKVCAPEDPVCSDGLNFAAHDTYAGGGDFVTQGVDFAVSHLGRPAGGPPRRGGGFGE
jgi:cutinase